MANLDFTHLSGSDNAYIDGLYEDYKKDKTLVDESWKNFFDGYEFALVKDPSLDLKELSSVAPALGASSDIDKEFKIFRIIQSYRARGHLLSKTNPIRPRKNRAPHLSLEDYGLSNNDLNFQSICGDYLGIGKCSLKKIIEFVDQIYCKSLGYEFMHVENTEIRRWFRNKIEREKGLVNFPIEKKKRILEKLNQAVVFENFLNTKYVGQKRFSLEGAENTVVALDAIIDTAQLNGVEEVVIGMAHRGRLNVLANTLGKTYEYIFNEFEGNINPEDTFGDGDVKYHLGFRSYVETRSKEKVYCKLMPNPSHLEAVGPVVQGYSRAQSDILYSGEHKKVLPIILHGDAAVAGQGVVYESVQMSRLIGFHVGGTIHFVINNQIGFTTDFTDARSSTYCTSAARVINVPIIHVNGDDAEAVVFAVELATEFRQKFGEDIFIDMVGYRKHGHNEGDEPKFTQPNLYKLIGNHPNPREVYLNKLIDGKSIEVDLANQMEAQFRSLLQSRFNMLKETTIEYKPQQPDKEWESLKRASDEDFEYNPKTGFPREGLEKIYQSLITIPEHITPIKKAGRIIQDRVKRWEGDNLNWAMGELLAYGSLLEDGIAIRMSGQDVVRGTFSHRHAGIFDESGDEIYLNLNSISNTQARFRIYNSLLSEYAVLGFEYGYSLGRPTDINIWEAQFGDFANGAQTVFDQFISSGESKWGIMSGLITYLPHGYEGQGPEHSNARPERVLQLAAELNMVVANVTTPANLFHLLRRHVTWNFRKPLVLFTPKSLLRHPECTSKISDLTSGRFEDLIIDADANENNARRLIMCTGKIYFDLIKYKRDNEISDVDIVRLEQMYPLPDKKIAGLLERYRCEKVWVQEEPKNMGPWTYLLRYDHFRDFKLISRKSSASPATGFSAVHKLEQQKITKLAFE